MSPSSTARPSAPSANDHPSPSHRITVSPPHDSAPPCQLGTPSLFASLLLNAFRTRNTNALLHAFSSHATPNATLDGRPLLTVLPLHPLSQMHISREIAYAEHSRTDSHASYTFTFDRAPLSPSRASFRFDFARTDTQGWLIAAITTLDSS